MKNTKTKYLILICCGLVMASVLFASCSKKNKQLQKNRSDYFSSDDGIQTGGVKLVEIQTPKGSFNIWTKRIGNNPKIKVLLLAGGPGASTEYLECVESFFPREGIEFIYYDQLGTGRSNNPQDTALYDLNRSVEELEQVREALHLTNDNFYLFGHSWGGIVAMEYALKYQQHLKALIVSDMMSSAADYNKYASEVLAKQIDADALAEIRKIEAAEDFDNPQYMNLLIPHFYTKFICRMPLEDWPEPLNRAFEKLNHDFYMTMQGPSEFGLRGKLLNWDIKSRLSEIQVPTLTIGAKYDTMDPEHMKWISSQVKHGSYLFCPNGSHMCFYDDQKIYFRGLIHYIKAIDTGVKEVSFDELNNDSTV